MKLDKNLEDCTHSEYCIKKKSDHRKYCSNYRYKTCETAKGYDNYGENYNQLGIGGSTELEDEQYPGIE